MHPSMLTGNRVIVTISNREKFSRCHVKYLKLRCIRTDMSNTAEKTPGARRMNAFPVIVLLITLALAAVVYMELI